MNEIEHAAAGNSDYGRSDTARAARAEAARRAASLAVGIALSLGAANCWAQASALARSRAPQEIAPFRLTGIDGYAQINFLRDDNGSAGQAGGAGSRTRQSVLTEEIFLMTHSYVYHPSLLSLDLGGGPVMEQSSYGTDGVATNSRRQLYNLSGRAMFLRDKPYTGALFYDHRNQTQNLAPAQVMVTENTRYGLNFSLLGPVTPLPMQVELIHYENVGKSVDQIIEDRTDQVRLKVEANVGNLGRSTLLYVGMRQDAASGSPGLPIQASSTTNDSANLDTRLKFGARNEYDLGNVVTLNTNKYTVGRGSLTQLQDLRFGLDLRGRHSDRLQTYLRYNLNTSKQDDQQGEQTMNFNSASAEASYRFTPDLYGSLTARGEKNQTTQFDSTVRGIDGSAQYQRTLPLGQATAGYNFSYSQRDQQATAQQVQLIGEHVTLPGTTLVQLSKQQIIASTVVVSNLTRTQTFVEGLDYALSQIGINLSIQRLIGGNILDGQEVLTDYAYEAGGTYALSQFDNAVSFNWAIKNYINVFLRYVDSAPRLTSGTPTSPINPIQSTSYGTYGELPLSLLSQEILLGGRAEREDRRETISPYKRGNYEAYAQVELPVVRSGNIRIGTRHTQVDYDLSPLQSVNLTAYDLRLWARAGYGVDLYAEAHQERDTGTPVARERASASLKAQWRRRKFIWTAELTRVRDAQGAVETTRTYGQILLRRDF